MLLYVVRHAYAGQRGDPHWPDDNLRPLTKKGRRRFGRMVKRLARRGFAPTLVSTSPLVRCRQTADELAARLDEPPKVVQSDDLRPGGEWQALVEWSNRQQVDELAWVGHAPEVDQIAAALVGAHEDTFAFAKGAIAAIEFDRPIAEGAGQLRWLVVPKIM